MLTTKSSAMEFVEFINDLSNMIPLELDSFAKPDVEFEKSLTCISVNYIISTDKYVIEMRIYICDDKTGIDDIGVYDKFTNDVGITTRCEIGEIFRNEFNKLMKKFI